ncbi:MAG: RNA methyltransferase [Planctomycetota bacterium]|nr:RNA methyltransferase [Planctomycetota bacterium]
MILTTAERRRIDDIARGRSAEPLFVLEGRRAVRDALENNVVAELWVHSTEYEDPHADLRALASERGVPVGHGGAKDFERLGKTVSPQGVLALVHGAERPLAAVAALPGLLLWLDGVQDPGNVGAIVRVAVAFGAAGLLVGEGTAHPLGLKALRASTGLALRVPYARGDGDAIAAALGTRDVWMLERDGEDVFALGDVPSDLALVVGAEGPGPGAAARAAANRALGIPIEPGVDSLNAAVAAGIVMAVLRRTR